MYLDAINYYMNTIINTMVYKYFKQPLYNCSLVLISGK